MFVSRVAGELTEGAYLVRAAWQRLPSVVRITIESIALLIAIDSLQRFSGYTAPTDSPFVAFLVNEVKVAVPIMLSVLRTLQARPQAA